MEEEVIKKSRKVPGRIPINKWPAYDQPREKLANRGAEVLSSSELLAVLLRCGTPEKSAIEIGLELLNLTNHDLSALAKKSVKQLQAVKGVGEAKAIMILAALELGRRKDSAIPADLPVISASNSVAGYLKAQLRDKNQEVFGVVYLKQGNRVKQFDILSTGGICGTVADPRIILKKALEHEAVAMILVHNHPSGNLSPSNADRELTIKIREAAKYHEIRLMDHIIVSERGYYSFAENGYL